MNITAVIIIKNEEERITSCLQKLVNIFDYIVVYDTGSSDRSLYMVKQFNHDHVQLVTGEWEESFAKARNRALGFVNTDWAIFIDADEELVSNKKQVEHELTIINSSPNSNVYCPEILLEDNSIVTTNTRIIRVSSNDRYIGRVHEYVPTDEIISCGIRLRHNGYTPLNKKGKETRNLKLLRKQIIEDRKNPRWLYFVTSNYDSIDWKTRLSIVDHLLNNVLCRDKDAHYFSGCISTAFRLSFASGDIQLLSKYLKIAELFSPKNIDFVFYKYLSQYINIKSIYHSELCLILKNLNKEKELEYFDNNYESFNSIIDLRNLILFSNEKFNEIREVDCCEDSSVTLLNIEINKYRDIIHGRD